MNIKTPFELLELTKKDIITKLKENKIKYKIQDCFIKFNQVIEELKLDCEVSVNCMFKKVNSISYKYNFDNNLENELIFKEIDKLKEIYKSNFMIESYFDPKDGKIFAYRLCYENFGIYLQGTSYFSKEVDKYVGITYRRNNKQASPTQKIVKEKQLIIKEKSIKRLDKSINNDNLNKWYGLQFCVINSNAKSGLVRVDVLDDKLIVYYINSFKIRSFEIEYNKIKRYDLYEDFVRISYDNKMFMYTIIKNDVSTFDNIICDKIGYNSVEYQTLKEIVLEAFIEYDVFNNSSFKEKRNQRYINEITKTLFKVEDLNNEIMYNILQGIDFYMYIYCEWKKFSDCLYKKLKECNYF